MTPPHPTGSWAWLWRRIVIAFNILKGFRILTWVLFLGSFGSFADGLIAYLQKQ